MTENQPNHELHWQRLPIRPSSAGGDASFIYVQVDEAGRATGINPIDESVPVLPVDAQGQPGQRGYSVGYGRIEWRRQADDGQKPC